MTVRLKPHIELEPLVADAHRKDGGESRVWEAETGYAIPISADHVTAARSRIGSYRTNGNGSLWQRMIGNLRVSENNEEARLSMGVRQRRAINRHDGYWARLGRDR